MCSELITAAQMSPFESF